MPSLTLDHAIIAAADLDAAASALTAVLGRTPSWRGKHPSYGTANVLFRLDNAYLELLAPDPAATSDTAWTGSLGRFLTARGDGLFSIALQTADVYATTAAARARGLPVEDPLPGTGQDLRTGAVREWVNARIPPEATRGTRTFFIQHQSPPGALPDAPFSTDPEAAVSGITAVVASSRDAVEARRMWREVFGLVESESGPAGWRFSLGSVNLFVQAGADAAAEAPDAWDSLVLTVPNLDAAARRLQASGISVHQGSAAARTGLEVRACGARLLLTEAK